LNQVNVPSWAFEAGRARGGFSTVDPRATALVVVDLQNLFMVPGQALANAHARDIVPNVNALARALRAAGGTVAFLRHTVSDEPRYRLTEWQARMVPRNADGGFELQAGSYGHALFDQLDVRAGDLVVNKHRYSAFLPNSSDLDTQLRARGIDTLIITGTVTNVCCESTARDGNMLGYRIVFVSDGTAALSDAEHNATLLSMATVFAEVRPTAATLELLRAGT